jgi:Mala s 1-like protein
LTWEKWWNVNAARVDLSRATRDEVYLGLNLVVELDGASKGGKGRVWECGTDGKPRWEIKDLERPIDARLLPNGSVLIAEHSPPRVTERRRDGAVVWEYLPPGQPVACQRLPNGNTFIATCNELVEVNREKAVIFSIKLPMHMVFFGSKLRNGHVVYVASNNRVVELDTTGKELNSISIENSGSWASVEVLANGNFLVALYNSKKVVEINRAGEVTWQCNVEAPGHATRLRNGNILVASIEGRRIAEIDRAGKEVWRHTTPGRPFTAYRR